MSRENVKKFFISLEADASLRKKIREAAMKNTDETTIGSLVEFGKTAGFEFTKEELLAFRSEMIDRPVENRELSDDDLAQVAGGAPYSYPGQSPAIMSILRRDQCPEF